jgi:hypothetical protein
VFSVAGNEFIRKIGKVQTRLAFLALTMTSGCGGSEATSNVSSNRQAAVAPASPETVPAEIADAVVNWSKCRTARVLVLAQTPRSDESVVDEALRECIAFERATTNLWEKHYGPNSGGQVHDLRLRWREGLIANVRQMRSGTPLTGDDPSRRWGICVGEKIPNSLPVNVTSDSIVDSAMQACSGEMEKVQANYAQRYGVADAATYVEQMRLRIRKLAVETVEETRSSQ